MERLELVNKIDNLTQEIEELKQSINDFEYESTEEEYDEMLDAEGLVTVCGYEFCPSAILKECDPTAYRCGKSDYDSNFDLDDCSEYTDMVDRLEGLEEELGELQEELNALDDED